MSGLLSIPSGHLFTWSVQVLLLTAAASLASLTLTSAKARLIFWQGFLLVMLLLPVVEPWQSRPIRVRESEPETVSVATAASDMTRPAFRWNWLLLIAAGATLRVAWIAAGFLRLRGYRRRAILLTEPPFRFASTSARWYVSDTVPGPVTYGWRQPSILLPSRIMQLPCSLREAIAAHELMHVLRRDWLFVLAEEAIRSLLWFHPAVWYVLGRVQLAREQVVDGEVIRLTQDRDCYLDALVEVAAQRLHPDLAPAPLFMRKRHLAERVAAVLKEVPMSKSRIAAGLTAACSAMFIVARVAIWFVPFESPAQTVLDDPGVNVDPGAVLRHRAPIHNPARVTGVITLEASVNAQGEVSDARILSGPEDLRKEALSSVLQWHYNPGMSRVQITMRFDPVTPARLAPPAPPSPPAPPVPPTPPLPPATRVAISPLAPPLPPRPPLPAQALRMTTIELVGFSSAAEQELRTRLPFREGDLVTQEDLNRAFAVTKDFDSHATIAYSPLSNRGEMGMRISVLPNTTTFPSPPSPRPADPPGRRVIGGVVMQQNLIRKVTPIYPPLAKGAGIQGQVKFTVNIGKDGTVQDVEFVSGHPLLVSAAREAVSQWVYNPTLLNGEPIDVTTDVTVNFTLAQ